MCVCMCVCVPMRPCMCMCICFCVCECVCEILWRARCEILGCRDMHHSTMQHTLQQNTATHCTTLASRESLEYWEIGLICRDIAFFYWEVGQRVPGENLCCWGLALFCRDVAHFSRENCARYRRFGPLFSRYSLFCPEVRLFYNDIGLFCQNMGLFCWDLRLFGRK